MEIIKEVEQGKILEKDFDYFLSGAKKLYGLRNYSRLLLGKLVLLAINKFAGGDMRSDEGKAVVILLSEATGVRKRTLFQYVWLWRRLGKKGIRDFSSLPFRDYRRLASSPDPKKELRKLIKERESEK